MSNIRTKLFGLAAVATAFAGMSYGQAITGCTAGTGGPLPLNPTLRAEGETELVSDETVTGCTNTIATTGTVFATLTLPVTSKALTPPVGSPGGGNSEAILTLTPAAAPAVTYYGTVSGSTISFSNVAFPTGAFSYQISNVRVNASGGGAPAVTETDVINYSTGATTSSNLAFTAQPVGYILTTLGATTLPFGTTNSFTACAGNVIPGTQTTTPAGNQITMQVNFRELVGGAFKGPGPAPTGEGGSLVVPATGAGTATSATQLAVTYANVPAAATIYVPSTITITTSAGNATTLTTTGTPPTSGAYSAPYTAVAPNTAVYGAYVPFTGGGTVTVTYTVSLTGTGAAGAQTWVVPTVVSVAGNAAAAQSFITANVAYAPSGSVTGPASVIPTFAASTLPAANGATITTCQTSLLFPFLTNQLGFDTGIVLANTTTDNIGVAGKAVATPQSGTCTLSFYGAGAPTPSVAVADPGGSTASGTTHAFLLSSVAPGFQGYGIAVCPFLDAHGFAFIEYDLTQANGVVEGYLAPILNNRAATAAETTTF